jgi:hypothetical protein
MVAVVDANANANANERLYSNELVRLDGCSDYPENDKARL